MATLTILAQTIEIDGVGDVMVTPVVQDPDIGDYVREIRVFGEIPIGGGTAPLIATVRIRHAQAINLKVSVPASDF